MKSAMSVFAHKIARRTLSFYGKIGRDGALLGIRIVAYAAVFLLLFNTIQAATPQSSQTVLGASTINTPSNLRIGSFNTLWRGFDPDVVPGNTWEERLTRVQSALAYANYDIVGMQEVWDTSQYSDIANLIPGGYRSTNPGETEGKNPIFYNYSRFKLLSSGAFMLISGENKSCTWAKFMDLSNNTEFYIYNLHLDSQNENYRRDSITDVIGKIQKTTRPSDTVFLIGDFNSSSADPNGVDAKIRAAGFIDTYTITPTNKLVGDTYSTFHGYRASSDYKDLRIDRLYIRSSHTPVSNRYETITTKFNGAYASDHYPISADLSI